MSLNNISDELILEVARQIECLQYQSNKSLGPLALCSRRLNDIVSPLLYRKFTQGWGKPTLLPNLLRLVIDKPRIGAEIKILVLREVDDDKDEELLDMSGYSPQDFERCRAVMDSLISLPINKLEWMEALERGKWDAVAAFLLFFLPLLEEMEIESGGSSSLTYFNQVVNYMAIQHHVENPSHSLKRLKSFSTAYWDTENGMGLYSILPFCALPSVTTVSAFSLEEEDGFEPYRPPTERYQVQNLRMDNSCIGGNRIKWLLRSFTSLQKLYYSHGGATVGMADLLPQRIGQGLAHLHDSLEELTVVGTKCDEIYGDEDRGPLGTLVSFRKLRYIMTEAEVLFGQDSELVKPELVNILPASLETLNLAGCKDDIYPQLRDLISHGERKFPALKTVTINIPKAWAGGLIRIGPDGLVQGADEIRQRIEQYLSGPWFPDMERQLSELHMELMVASQTEPTEAEREEWRTRQATEKELINDFGEVGIDLCFARS